MTTGYSERKTLTGKHWRPSVSTKEELEKKAGTWNCSCKGGNGNRPIENPYSRTPLNNGRHPQDHGGDGRKAGNGNQRDQSRSGKAKPADNPCPIQTESKVYTISPYRFYCEGTGNIK